MKRLLYLGSLDIFFTTLLIVCGYLLIGFYIGYHYLATGYPDWIYHAFRIKSLASHGLVSWDHIWTNGINYWQGYPAGVHFLVLAVTYLTRLSITDSMMLLTVVVFVLIRVFSYFVLRYLRIESFYAFFAVVLSYGFGHQWIAISDFSLFVVMLLIPIYLLLWAKASDQKKYFAVLAAFTGLMWNAHPVLGYTLSALFFTLVVFRHHALRKRGLILIFSIYALGISYFFATQFLAGYSYSNPTFSINQFWKTTVNSPYFGLSLVYVILIGLGWGVLFLRTENVPRWVKILHLFLTLYLIFIWTALNGYIPNWVGPLQISRALTVVGFLLPFSFASLVQVAFLGIRSRFVPGILVIIIAISLSVSIEISSQFSGQPVSTIENPVAQYFGIRVPQGSIYFDNVSEASYFGNPGLRYVTSYNEHRDPHPLGQRFKNLMKSDSAYTGVSEQQIDLIDGYSRVLGVEYVFLPELSPLVDALTVSKIRTASFSKIGTVTTKDGTYSVLHADFPITYAYTINWSDMQSSLLLSSLAQPNLFADSFKAWDDEVMRINELIQSGALHPVSLRFIDTDRLFIDVGDASGASQSLVVMQSFDANWQFEDSKALKLQPTALKFMYIGSGNGQLPAIVTLKNSWPWWHWGLQILGIVNLFVCGLYSLLQREKREII